MQKLLKKIAELLRLSRLGKRWKKVAVILAVIVVFCTTYMLILPAITIESELVCGLQEHVHSDSCYAVYEFVSGEDASEATSEKTLICTLQEHTHSDDCYVFEQKDEPDINTLDEYTREIVEYVISLIDALPDYDEINETLNEYDANGDEDGAAEYFTNIKKEAYTAYYTYSILGSYKKYVTNADKLYDLEWLWSAADLGLNSDGNFELDIYEVNSYYSGSVHPPIIIYGGSPSEVGISGFQWWIGIVVDSDSDGNFYVSSIESNLGSSYPKSDLKPSTSDGFVVFIWSGYGEYSSAVSNIAVGDGVIVDFNYMSTSSYSGTALGTVTFGDVIEEEAELHIVESAYTKDLITINLFDYGYNINDMYTSNNSYPGFQQDYGTRTTLSSIGAYNMNFGNTVTQDILAGISGLTTGATGINRIVDINSCLEGEMSYLLGDDGYPVMSNDLSLAYLFTDNTYAEKQNTDNITGLFRQNTDTGEYFYDSHLNHAQFDSDTDTFILYSEKISANYMMYPFGNFLPFTDIENDATQSSKMGGTYLTRIAQRAYNRYLNGEGKNSTDEYLGLYNALTSFVSIMNKNYTSGWSAKDCANLYFKLNSVVDSSGNYVTFTNDDLEDIYTLDYDIPTDFYFGMEMELNFIQPKGGLTGTTGNEPLNFRFTGDDDVWIYVDGVLFLDLSGIHRHVGGEIDFVNGLVHYYMLDTTIGDVSSEPYKTETFAEVLERAGKSTEALNENGTFEDYTQHTLKFFYMERGSGSGVCCMNFNLPLVKDNTVAITKELSTDSGESADTLGDPYFFFQVLKAEEGVKTDELFIGANTAYEVLDEAGNKLRDAVTDSDGIIRIKAGETAVITTDSDSGDEYFVRELIDKKYVPQYVDIYIDGLSSDTFIEDITIGETSYAGYESVIKDLLIDGHTSFAFDNSISLAELGALKLTKELEGSETDESFIFNVTLDGEPIPEGTAYTLISSDGTETSSSVTSSGQISLKAGETAFIEGLIAGTQFTVTEDSVSKGEYSLSYRESGDYYTTDGDTATGYILPSSTAQFITVTAVNSEYGASVTLDGTKTLELSDGNEHTYTVMLSQVTDITGATLTENGTELKTDVYLTGESGESAESGFSFTLNYYYTQTQFGESKYYYRIYEYASESLLDSTEFDNTFYVAEVTVNKTEDEITAMITALYKNGEEVYAGEIQFVNTLIGELTVTKTVEGNTDEADFSTEFVFELEFVYMGSALSGTYVLQKTDSSSEISESELTVTDGKAEITLCHGESVTVKGIPVGTAVTVTEQTEGYYVTYSLSGSDVRNDGNTCTADISVGQSGINFFNHAAYVLPETGGCGAQMYIIGGLLISLSAVFLLGYTKKRRGRRSEGSKL